MTDCPKLYLHLKVFRNREIRSEKKVESDSVLVAMGWLATNKIVQQYFTAVEKGKSSGNRGYRLPEVLVNRRLPSLQELPKRWAV